MSTKARATVKDSHSDMHCPICGKYFAVLRLSHLRVHGIVTWDQFYELTDSEESSAERLTTEFVSEVVQAILPPDPVPEQIPREPLPQDFVGASAQSILDLGDLPPESKERLLGVASGFDTFIGQLQAASQLRRIRWLSGAMSKLGLLDDELMNPDKFALYTFDQQMRLSEHIQKNAAVIMAEMQQAKGKQGGSGDTLGGLMDAIASGRIKVVATNVDLPTTKAISDAPAQVRSGLLQQVEKLLGGEAIRVTPP